MIDSTAARAEILAKIGSAAARGASAESAEAEWEAIPRKYRQTSSLAPAECIELLIERLRDYGATVDRCTRGELAAKIAQILAGRNKKRMLVAPDVDSNLLTDGECRFVADNGLSYEEIDACDGVITGCALAIAATGTLALCHESSGRRALTLIPDYHLCIVRASDAVETVPEAMRALEPEKNQPITLVSGPSATADIEMTRIQGVHGPRVLDVVIVG